MPADNDSQIAGELLDVQRTLGWMDLVIGSIGDAVYVTNGEGRIVFANQFFSNVVGTPRVFLLGEILQDVFPVRLKDVPISEYASTDDLSLLPGNKHFGIYNWTDKDGRAFIFRISYQQLDTTSQTVYLAQNITHEYQMSKMKNSFIDLASHQLRTPMTAIMTYAHMLNDGFAGDLNDDQQRLASTILQSSERMIKLVNDLLTITRLQNSSNDSDQSYSTVKQLFKKLDSEIKHRMEEKKLVFSTSAGKDTGGLKVNESILHEILSNLIINAVQYTPEGGAVTVEAEHSDDSLTIAVRDTGIGIPKSYLPDMFKQFSRGDNALSAFPEGTGLGLYMIKILTDKVGGTIVCDSEVGIGTTFTVCLPLAKIQPQ